MKSNRSLKASRMGAQGVSVILPCLNEAHTLALCVEKAQRGLKALGLPGEVVVADNGSKDGSTQIAGAHGARVVAVSQKGYGHALIGGMAAARGRYLIMGDADGSYDLAALAPFVEKMKQGFDMVIGNRFLGGIEPGAMPLKNRLVGNPVMTGFFRFFFPAHLGDVCCGFRAMTRETFRKISLKTGGMESAVEMIALSLQEGFRVGEVPVTLSKDGRGRPSHLRPWRDGAATLAWIAGAWWEWKRKRALKPEAGGVLPQEEA